MSNPLPIGPGSRVMSGCRAFLVWNGDTVAFATGVNWTEEVMYEAIEVLGHPEPVENAPIGYRVTVSASVVRTIARRDVSNAGDSPGSLKEQNIFPKFNQILKVDGVDMAIVDSITNKVVMMLTRVKCASYNGSVTPRGIIGQNLTFVAIRAMDESEVSAAKQAA